MIRLELRLVRANKYRLCVCKNSVIIEQLGTLVKTFEGNVLLRIDFGRLQFYIANGTPIRVGSFLQAENDWVVLFQQFLDKTVFSI
jgi:hypothetical protein